MIIVRRYQADQISPDLVNRLAGNSLFASYAFCCLWQSLGGRPVFWTAEEDGHTLALLCGVEFGSRPVVRFQSMPDGCYCRLATSDLVSSQRVVVKQKLIEALHSAGYLKLYLYDFFGEFEGFPPFESLDCCTSMVDISDNNWQPPDKKIQSEIRKAEREGINVEQFDRSRHMENFLLLMDSTETRHGRDPKYPPEFYKALAELSETDERVSWSWVEHEGCPAASHINLIEGDMILNWQVFFDKQFSFLKPNQYLLFRAAKDSSVVGVRYLNLGASPDDAPELEAYKEKWGGYSHHYKCYWKKSGLGRLF